MILMDIEILNNVNIEFGSDIIVEFINLYEKYENNTNNIITKSSIKLNEKFKIKISIIELLGKGSYGTVYKILINNETYALKFSNNERPNKMLKRFESLNKNSIIKNNIVKIYCAGKTINNNKIYYSIMEYGGISLKRFNFTNNNDVIYILKQLYEIVNESVTSRILITDFKLSNLTINNQLKVNLIDYYIKCEKYEPCTNCKVIRSFSCVEYEKEHNIYENKQYNYTGIYIPFAICIINLLCINSINQCCDKINSKFNLNIENKKMVFLLQIACYNYNNTSNSSIKKYKKVYKYKKSMEKNYVMLKNNVFYKYFIDLLIPKDELSNVFNYKKISLIINDLINLNPEQRSLKHLANVIIK